MVTTFQGNTTRLNIAQNDAVHERCLNNLPFESNGQLEAGVTATASNGLVWNQMLMGIKSESVA